MSSDPAVSRVPPPPKPLPADLNIHKTESGLELHRVYGRKRRVEDFNPSVKQLGRFSPIYDAAGAVVPVLYAGESMECAYFETIFHDQVSDPASSKPSSQIEERRYGTITIMRPLKLVKLFGPDLARLGMTVDQLTHCGPDHYESTARWAEAIHNQDATVDGLVWTSYRGDPDRSYVLFGDRVSTKHIEPQRENVEILKDPAALATLQKCGTRIGVVIALSVAP
jgi:hypothetical protein